MFTKFWQKEPFTMSKKKESLAILLLALLALSACKPTPTEAPPTPTLTATSAPVVSNTPETPLTIATPAAAGFCEAVPLPTVDIRAWDETD